MAMPCDAAPHEVLVLPIGVVVGVSAAEDARAATSVEATLAEAEPREAH